MNIKQDSIDSDNPFLTIEGDISDVPTVSGQPEGMIIGLMPNSATLTILVNCVLNFTDVVCIFAEDYGGITQLCTLLKTFPTIAEKSTNPEMVKPQLIVVHEDLNLMRPEVINEDLFSDIPRRLFSRTTLHYSDLKKPPRFRYSDLQSCIDTCMVSSRQAKLAARVVFSATHLSALMDGCLRHAMRASHLTFDMLAFARPGENLQPTAHFANFLALSQRLLYGEVEDHLVSCLTLNALPPRMHVFDPRFIFRQLFQQPLFQAYSQLGIKNTIDMTHSIELRFCAKINNGETNAKQHIKRIQTLSTRSKHWQNMRSNSTCLSCIMRPPEHNLSCGHAICDTCVQIFSKGCTGYECHSLSNCTICGTNVNAKIMLKPRTAGPRILSIDGGGSRGIVPLETLLVLQELVGPDCSICELFDYCIGTSAGGLIILGLFAAGWSVKKSKRTFETLVKRVFDKCGMETQTVLGQVRRFFKSALTDSVYDVRNLEQALQDSFGCDKTLFEFNSATQSGTKIAATATTDVEPIARLFCNYNGPNRISNECGYHIERPSNPEHEPRVWQIGRATSAVPILFPPTKLPNLGIYWDGALSRHNNPVNLALWESFRLWPEHDTPDVVLSLGTGVAVPESSSLWQMVSCRGIPKLWSSLMFFLDGEEPWKDLCNRLSEKRKRDYFRLNIPLSKSHRLDETKSMNELCKAVRSQADNGFQLLEALSALLSTSFYFELTRKPVKKNGAWVIDGHLLCRAQNCQSLITSFHNLVSETIKICNGERILGTLSEGDICSICQRYSFPINLIVDRLDQAIELQLSWLDNTKQQQYRRVSAMPKVVTWFVEVQEMDRSFGSGNYGMPGMRGCVGCGDDVHVNPSLKRQISQEQILHSKRRKGRRTY